MSLDEFMGIDPDDSLRDILKDCHGFFGTTVDTWKLEATISEHPELWWSRELRCFICGEEVVGYREKKGYRCDAHMSSDLRVLLCVTLIPNPLVPTIDGPL